MFANLFCNFHIFKSNLFKSSSKDSANFTFMIFIDLVNFFFRFYSSLQLLLLFFLDFSLSCHG